MGVSCFGVVPVKGIPLLYEKRLMTGPVTSLHRQMRNPLKSQLLHDFVCAVLDEFSVTSSPTQELTAVICVAERFQRNPGMCCL